MDIARYSITKPVNSWLIVIIALLGGLWGMSAVGRLEDPAFTIKQAQVITQYPGASAVEVEEEVTELLETAIQQMPQLDEVKSVSQPGLSRIDVIIKDNYDGNELPQVWDELRRKVEDAETDLPDGAKKPLVYDSFGDVYGLYFALTGEGYSNAQMREIAKRIRRELLMVEGVGKVDVRGAPEDRLYLDVDMDRVAQLGISLADVIAVLEAENAMQPMGTARIGDRRVRIVPDPLFDAYDSITDLKVGIPGSTAQVAITDFAELTVGEPEDPQQRIRFNGKPAITLGISQVPDTNIVEVGAAVSERMRLIRAALPLGVEITPIYQQDVIVDEAVSGFIYNLAMSVAIVILVLCVFMGWRAGLVVGAVLLLTVLATVFFMAIFGISMERISLGALIIAMGMLVDNAIVVAEGMMIGMQRGQRGIDAASAVVKQTKWPLLGATVIGIMAFSGIGLSPDATGEFLFSLFAVIGISLLLSWVFAVTVTPMLGNYLFQTAKRDEESQEEPELYKGAFYSAYRLLLNAALHARWLTVGLLLMITVACYIGFGSVKQAFFPDSNTPIFYINYWLPQGTDIRATERDMMDIEALVLADPRVEAATTLIGQGATRFMLTYQAESRNASYGQLLIQVHDRDEINQLALDLRGQIMAKHPDADVYTQRIVFGPGGGSKIEVRFKGPDADVLRALGEKARLYMSSDEAGLKDVRTDWRQREAVVLPLLDEDRARIGGITRSDLAFSMRFATDGVQAGSLRHGDEIVPIIAREDHTDNKAPIDMLQDLQVWSNQQRTYVPVAQLVSAFDTELEDTLIHRADRIRTLTVKADQIGNETADSARKRILDHIEAIDLPSGYTMEWGGEFESSTEAQQSLGAKLPVGFLVMILITILLFGAVRQPLLIWLMVPMSVNGVAIGLLATNTPFGFVALLGMLSLSGMLIKNAIVLLDEIDLQINAGKERYQAIVDASVSRMRPVMLAAITTVLGMAPLVFDAFFKGMAVAIMGGLSFATILTLIAAPVLYALLFGIKPSSARQLKAQQA